MYLLDTNVVSEARKIGDGRSDMNVARWLAAQDAATLFISVVTVMELEIGVKRIERRDEAQGLLLRTWLTDKVIPAFSGRILPIDLETARICASLHVPDPRAERDALIAATALAKRLTVVTRNLSDFQKTGVRLLDPWTVVLADYEDL
jgi:predicted nucleic acid-binding protein